MASGCWRCWGRSAHERPFALHRIGPYTMPASKAALAHLDLECSETRPPLAGISLDFEPAGTFAAMRFRCRRRRAGSSCTFCLSATHRPARWRAPRCGAHPGLGRSGLRQLLWQARAANIPAVLIADQPLARECAAASISGVGASALLRHYSAALVAARKGSRLSHKSSIPAAAIVQPWDVVDNAFSRCCNLRPPARPSRLNKLPHFLLGRAHQSPRRILMGSGRLCHLSSARAGAGACA